MGRDVVGKLSLEIVVTDAENVQVFLILINFDVERKISFQKSIGFIAVLTECSVSDAIFMSVILRLVTNGLL